MSTCTLLILLVTTVMTFLAFQRPHLEQRWIFDPALILRAKEWRRMLTAGFIHADWMHFLMNVISLVSFAQTIEEVYGPWVLLLVYLGSILGGNLFALILHRHHVYRALGASGGVCGVLFASIFLLPGMSVGILFLPIGIPGWLYALLFIIGSYYGMRNNASRVGHDAHLGGAMVGLLLATVLYPSLMLAQWIMYLIVVVAGGAALWFLLHDPHVAGGSVGGLFSAPDTAGGSRLRDYDYNQRARAEREQIDRILDKISRKGLHSLSRSERELLERYSSRRS